MLQSKHGYRNSRAERTISECSTSTVSNTSSSSVTTEEPGKYILTSSTAPSTALSTALSTRSTYLFYCPLLQPAPAASFYCPFLLLLALCTLYSVLGDVCIQDANAKLHVTDEVDVIGSSDSDELSSAGSDGGMIVTTKKLSLIDSSL